MKPTSIRVLVAIGVISAAIGWGLATLVDGQSGRVVPVPWLAAATLWLLALALTAWTLTSRPRLLRRPGARPMPPVLAARTAALAMAASRTGALLGGLYAGIAVGSIGQRMTPAGQSTLISATAAVIGALALTVIAVWLECLCRLPVSGKDEPPTGVGRVAS